MPIKTMPTKTGPSMIIETTNSVYEVSEGDKRFRRLERKGPTEDEFPVGRWYSYQFMTDPEAGEPVRFFWTVAQMGRSSRIGVCETSPVVRLRADDGRRFRQATKGPGARG
jgi:hypothetical protein